jgi:hypothetical protein
MYTFDLKNYASQSGKVVFGKVAAEANLCPFINKFNDTKFEIFLGILFRAYWEIKLCLKLY